MHLFMTNIGNSKIERKVKSKWSQKDACLFFCYLIVLDIPPSNADLYNCCSAPSGKSQQY